MRGADVAWVGGTLVVLGVVGAVLSRQVNKPKSSARVTPAAARPERPPPHISKETLDGARGAAREAVDANRYGARMKAKNDALAARSARRAFAENLEVQLLNQRKDTTVKAKGKDETTLHLTYVFCGRVFALDLEKAGILDEARRLGFKRFVCSDGYDGGGSMDL